MNVSLPKIVLLGLCLSLALGVRAAAQSAPSAKAGLNGKLYLSVDDEAQLILNGAPLLKAGLGESTSPEILLKSGDRLVVKLKNTLGKGRFMMLFVTGDQQRLINFRRAAFKVVPNPELTDFTVADFDRFPKQARGVTGEFGKPYMLPFKSTSEWIWGDGNVTTLGCLLTEDMFKPNPHVFGTTATSLPGDKATPIPAPAPAPAKGIPNPQAIGELPGLWVIRLQDGEMKWDFKPDGTLQANNGIYTWSIGNGVLRVTNPMGRTAVLQWPIKNGKMTGKDSAGRDLVAEKAGAK